jgi:hypothetical protein
MVFNPADLHGVHAVVLRNASHAHNFGWICSLMDRTRFFVLKTTWMWLLMKELPISTRATQNRGSR